MKSTKSSPGNNENKGSTWLRRADQACVACVLLVSLVVISVFTWGRFGRQADLIEIDRARPRVVEFKADINKADWPELSLLPGVGETLARRIVASREEEGPFLDIDDLQRVRGIGPKTVERMRVNLIPLPQSEAVAGP